MINSDLWMYNHACNHTLRNIGESLFTKTNRNFTMKFVSFRVQIHMKNLVAQQR